jgi:hypothetical protein
VGGRATVADNGTDDAQIHETIEKLVAEGASCGGEAGRDPDAAAVGPSEVVGGYEQ